MITLPLFLTRENKHWVGLFCFGFAAGLYLVANHFHLYPPQELPQWSLDRWIPFLPYTVWIYMSEYLFFPAAYVTSHQVNNANKYVYAVMTLQLISVLIFCFWPTTYPRGLYPLPEGLSDLTRKIFTTLRIADTPASCAPSLHVSSCYLSSFIFLNEQTEKFIFFFIWATAVAFSTLTTKQHYLIDVITGFGMAVLIYAIFYKWIKYGDSSQSLTAAVPGCQPRR